MNEQELTQNFVHQFTSGLISAFSNNEALGLSGAPGIFFMICCMVETVSIMKAAHEGAMQDAVKKTVTFLLLIATTLLVYSQSSIFSGGTPAGRNTDPLLDSHNLVRGVFDKFAAHLTEYGKPIATKDDPEGGENGVIRKLKSKSMASMICDKRAEGQKPACYKEMIAKPYPELKETFDKDAACGNFFTDNGCYFDQWVSVPGVTQLIIVVMSGMRTVLYYLVVVSYILTVVCAYLGLKVIFPFLVMSRTRSQIVQSIKFYYSTCLVAAVMAIIGYLVNSIVLGVVDFSHTAGQEDFAKMMVLNTMGAIIMLLAFLVEMVIYFKAPRIAKELVDLNLSGLVMISDSAKDAMQMGATILGFGLGVGGIAATAMGGLSVGKKWLGEKTAGGIGGLFNKTPGGGGGGGSPTGANFAGAQSSNATAGQAPVSPDLLSESYKKYANPTNSGSSSSDSESSGRSNFRGTAPESQINPTKLKNINLQNSSSEEGFESAESTWSKPRSSAPKPTRASGNSGNIEISNGRTKENNLSDVESRFNDIAEGKQKKEASGKKLGGIAKTGALGMMNLAGAGLQLMAGDTTKALNATQSSLTSAHAATKNANEAFEGAVHGSITSRDKIESIKKTSDGMSKMFVDAEKFQLQQQDLKKTVKERNRIKAMAENSEDMSDQERTDIEAHLEKLNKSIETQKADIQESRENYEKSKLFRTDFLVAGDFKADFDGNGKIDEGEIYNLISEGEDINSDRLRDVILNPEKYGANKIIEMKATQKKVEDDLLNRVHDDFEKLGAVRKSTREMIVDSARILGNKKAVRLAEMVNTKISKKK